MLRISTSGESTMGTGNSPVNEAIHLGLKAAGRTGKAGQDRRLIVTAKHRSTKPETRGPLLVNFGFTSLFSPSTFPLGPLRLPIQLPPPPALRKILIHSQSLATDSVLNSHWPGDRPVLDMALLFHSDQSSRGGRGSCSGADFY